MKKRNGIAAALAATLVITGSAVQANEGAAFIGGALLGALINNQVGKNQRQKQQTQKPRSTVNNYQRQQNREVQNALNDFGFPVGAADGQLGQRSRAGISNYQSYMGQQPTGYLDDFQRNQLVSSHQRLKAGGGGAYPRVVANEGPKGLLKAFADPTYEDRMYGGGQVAGVTNNNGVVDRNVPAPAPAIAPVTAAAPITNFAPLPMFDQAPTSMANHCELVAGMTQANQGVVLASNINDPEQALGEQFCEARSFAITQSQGILSQVRQPEDAVVASCAQIAEVMAPATAQIGTADVKLVATQAQQIANGVFNNDMQAAAGYGQLCLGLGYRQDDAEMALGAATVMLATGQMPYGEVLGHHLRWGFGTAAVPAASTSWYQSALTSMDQGAQPVFVPSKAAERNAIIRASIANTGQANVAPQPAIGGGLALPALNLGGN